MRNPFGRRLPKPLDDSASEIADADPYLAAMARGASRTFIDSTLTDQPPFHPISFRTKEQ